jgi:hypothetical protein
MKEEKKERKMKKKIKDRHSMVTEDLITEVETSNILVQTPLVLTQLACPVTCN